MGRSKSVIEEGRVEKRKAEICLIKLKYGNEIRSGDVFNELVFLSGNI
jgi:hypothetical protein